jgi:2-oxo-3-hexenedioate decarboxylase/2-keto-4-pentenoate hydratase
MTDLRAAANRIAAVRRSRTPLEALEGAAAPLTEADGYRIQQAVHGLLADLLGARMGYKIGCTSQVMQQYLDIPHPCRGGIFSQGIHDSGAVLRAGDFVRVGVECEIAVRLGRDVQAPFAAQNLASAIDAYLPAIEIVDDRYADWSRLGAPTLVADDFFAAGCVLGRPVAPSRSRDPGAVEGRAMINGVEAGQGTGADVLGHPHRALAWLADHLALDGQQLRAGDIVLTGSLVRTLWLKAGDHAVMELSGLGMVDVRFA